MIGCEIFDDLVDVDMVIVFVGGGGLILGVVMVIKEMKFLVCVIGVEFVLILKYYYSWINGE